jgi:hypothetical protein
MYLSHMEFIARRRGELQLRRSENVAKDAQAVLLWKSGFIEGADASSLDLGDSVVAQGLTWAGRDLLDTIQSKPVWDRIKTTASVGSQKEWTPGFSKSCHPPGPAAG